MLDKRLFVFWVALGEHVDGTQRTDSVPKNDGTVYTIYRLEPHSEVFPDYLGLILCEINGLIFDQCAFRPVVEHKTDISIFKKMLTPELVE